MVHQEICDDIAGFAHSSAARHQGVSVVHYRGDGNIEFFLGARRG